MKKMSTGQDSTLRNWIKMTTIFFGKDSAATAFLEKKATESPNGLDEEVIADEGQLVMVLGKMHIDNVEQVEQLKAISKVNEHNFGQ